MAFSSIGNAPPGATGYDMSFDVTPCHGIYPGCRETGPDTDRSRGTIGSMSRQFAATVWRDGDWYVSQCLELDVASQGQTEEEALANLREALELHFEEPRATRLSAVRTVEVEIGAA